MPSPDELAAEFDMMMRRPGIAVPDQRRAAVLSRYDALLTASAQCTAPRFDAPVDASSAAAPMRTIPFNVTDHPALRVPIGLASDGLPIGVRIVGRPFDKAMVFRVSRAVEVLSGWQDVPLPV